MNDTRTQPVTHVHAALALALCLGAALIAGCGEDTSACYAGPMVTYIAPDGHPVPDIGRHTLEVTFFASDGKQSFCRIETGEDGLSGEHDCDHEVDIAAPYAQLGERFNTSGLRDTRVNPSGVYAVAIHLKLDGDGWSGEAEFTDLEYQKHDGCRYAPVDFWLTAACYEGPNVAYIAPDGLHVRDIGRHTLEVTFFDADGKQSFCRIETGDDGISGEHDCDRDVFISSRYAYFGERYGASGVRAETISLKLDGEAWFGEAEFTDLKYQGREYDDCTFAPVRFLLTPKPQPSSTP